MGHFRTAAAALPAHRRCRSTNEIRCREFADQILRYSNDNGIGVFIRRNDCNHAATECLHLLIGQATQRLGLDTGDDLTHEVGIAHLLGFGLGT